MGKILSALLVLYHVKVKDNHVTHMIALLSVIHEFIVQSSSEGFHSGHRFMACFVFV
jgi:hypothetical protein